MAPRQSGSALRQLRDLISAQTTGRQADAQLLERFVHDQDEAAFAALMRRYGPLVLHAARRVLNDWQAAEDVFQATFLVLARRATSIRHQDSIGGWLHGVAYRLALKARHAARPREWYAAPPPEEVADPLADMTLRELRPVLDAELARIPEKYRAPLLLCYLEGKTRDEAAQQLGWPLGTLKSRLERGRELLRERLVHRGVALSAALWATALSADAAPVPAALLEDTLAAARQFAAGSLPAESVSAKALSLAQGMVNPMLPVKLKLVSALLLAVSLVGAAGLGRHAPQNAAAQAPAVAAEAAAPAEKAARADLAGDPLPPNALARLGTLRWRYTETIQFTAFVDEGKQLLTVGTDGNWRLWGVKTGAELKSFGKVAAAPAPADDYAALLAAQRLLNGASAVAVALSPDGTTLARSQGDGQVRFWDVESGKERGSFKAAQTVGGIAFAPDGKSLFVGGRDQVVRQHEVPSGKEQKSFGKPPAPPPAGAAVRVNQFGGDVAVSADGKRLAVTGSEVVNNRPVPHVKVWNLESGDEVAVVKPDGGFAVSHLTFAHDGKHVVYTTGDGTTRFAEVADPKNGRKFSEGRDRIRVTGLAFTADGKGLLEKRSDQTVHLLDPETGKDLRTYGQPFTAARGNVFIRFGSMAREMALAPDGKTLAVVGGLSTIRLYDVETGKEKQEFGGHQSTVAAAAVAPDGKTVLTRGADNTVRRWDPATGKELNSFKLPDGAAAAAFAPDGRSVAVALGDGAVRLFDVETGKERGRLALGGDQPVRRGFGSLSLAFSPDGKTLATRGNEPVVRLWDAASGKELRSMKEETKDEPAPNPGGAFFVKLGPASAGLAFTPDGTAVASVAGPNNAAMLRGQPAAAPTSHVYLFHTGTGKALARFEVPLNVTNCALSPDGRSIALVGSDQTISVREVASGQERCKFKAAANVLTFAPDGRTLAAAGPDRVVRVFDLAAGKERGQLTGHTGPVWALAFAADGRRLVSGSDDTSALVWDAAALTKAAPAADLDDKQCDALWADLLGDAAKAYPAVAKLSQCPRAVAFLRDRIKPAEGVDQKKVEALIADLESEKFAVRQQATDSLEKLGDLAVPFLEKVLAGQPSLEIKQRVERVLERLVEGQQAPPAEVLRAVRVVEALQQLGTPEAKELLQTLAKGAPGARLTREAQKSLDLLARRAN